MKKYSMIVLSFVTLFLRLYRLGDIPRGLSLAEVNLGLRLSSVSGIFNNPLFIRLPFALTGIVSVFIFYKVLQRLTDKSSVTMLGAYLLSSSPWHITQSRIFSWGLVIFTLLLITLLFLMNNLRMNAGKSLKPAIFIFIGLFLVSILNIPGNLRTNVDVERELATHAVPLSGAKLFSNKFVESYRYREGILMENLDIGNYFFTGHPRERWGIEEIPKFFVSYIVLIITGIMAVKKKQFSALISWSLIYLGVIVFTGQTGPSASLPLIIPFVLIAALGVLYFRKSKCGTYLLVFVFILFSLEFAVFFKHYFSGFSESTFSPRRPVFIEISKTINQLDPGKTALLVNNRILDSPAYLKFYLEDKSLANIQFKTFDYKELKDNKLVYIDFLPDDPSPVEPLYEEDGTWPDDIEVINEFYDAPKRQKIVIYKYHEQK